MNFLLDVVDPISRSKGHRPETKSSQGQRNDHGPLLKVINALFFAFTEVLSEPSLNGLPNLDWRRRFSLSSVAVEESSESEEPFDGRSLACFGSF